MDCEFTEKVSLLLDAELAPLDALRVKEHISVCPACRQAQSDFLRLRREIKAYDFQPKPFAKAGTLARILHSEKPPLWRRRVSMPLPLIVLLFTIVVGLGVWAATLRRAASLALREGAPEKAKLAREETSLQAAATDFKGVNFSGYYQGERAAIYKERRKASPADARQ